jgi:hypothetical protein
MRPYEKKWLQRKIHNLRQVAVLQNCKAISIFITALPISAAVMFVRSELECTTEELLDRKVAAPV